MYKSFLKFKTIPSLVLLGLGLSACGGGDEGERAESSGPSYNLTVDTQMDSAVVADFFTVNVNLDDLAVKQIEAVGVGADKAGSTMTNLSIRTDFGANGSDYAYAIGSCKNGVDVGESCKIDLMVLNIDKVDQYFVFTIVGEVDGQTIESKPISLPVKALTLINNKKNEIYTTGLNTLVLVNETGETVDLTSEKLRLETMVGNINGESLINTCQTVLQNYDTCIMMGDFVTAPQDRVGDEVVLEGYDQGISKTTPGFVNTKALSQYENPSLEIRPSYAFYYPEDVSKSFVISSLDVSFAGDKSQLVFNAGNGDAELSDSCRDLSQGSSCVVNYTASSWQEDMIAVTSNEVELGSMHLLDPNDLLISDVVVEEHEDSNEIRVTNNTAINIPLSDIQFITPTAELLESNGVILDNQCQSLEVLEAGDTCTITVKKDLDQEIRPQNVKFDVIMQVQDYVQNAQVEVRNAVTDEGNVVGLSFANEVIFYEGKDNVTQLVLQNTSLADIDLSQYQVDLPLILGVNYQNNTCQSGTLAPGQSCTIDIISSDRPENLSANSYNVSVYKLDNKDDKNVSYIHTKVPDISIAPSVSHIYSDEVKLIEIRNDSLAPALNVVLDQLASTDEYRIDLAQCQALIADNNGRLPSYSSCLVKVEANTLTKDYSQKITLSYDHDKTISADLQLLSTQVKMSLLPSTLTLKQLENGTQVLVNESNYYVNDIRVSALDANAPTIDYSSCKNGLAPLSECAINYTVPEQVAPQSYDYQISGSAVSSQVEDDLSFSMTTVITVLEASGLEGYVIIDKDGRYNSGFESPIRYNGYVEFDMIGEYVYFQSGFSNRVSEDIRWSIIASDKILDGLDYFKIDQSGRVFLNAQSLNGGLYTIKVQATNENDVSDVVTREFNILIHHSNSWFAQNYMIDNALNPGRFVGTVDVNAGAGQMVKGIDLVIKPVGIR
ncbi:hypothetical protein [Cysteiniphilum sp. QT6929]|uniref:COG1470 family protein n=1 Tax=Cysteiniphilum sp. QT6929 TaxID=2975055 RepID=UPI0024B3891E|nr:hypothetical protein [Cysteiniphilum sp. QT6929]WHN66263.1 hypothetical protein NYP54_03265 [Cysteiniphilum sp. QT6929]